MMFIPSFKPISFSNSQKSDISFGDQTRKGITMKAVGVLCSSLEDIDDIQITGVIKNKLERAKNTYTHIASTRFKKENPRHKNY